MRAAAQERKAQLRRLYGWRVGGEWQEPALDVLLQAGGAIQAAIEVLQQRPGDEWIRQYLPAVFHSGMGGVRRAIKPLRGKSFVFPLSDVWMEAGFERSPRAEEHVVHELGHVLDNRLGGWIPATFRGGGPADRLVRAVGGTPEKARLRFLPTAHYVSAISPLESWRQGAYGNVSVSEDFAETFVNTIFRPETVPLRRLAWMEAFLRSLACPPVKYESRERDGRV